MIHPLAGLLAPKRVAVVGPVTVPTTQAAKLWQHLQEKGIPASGIDPHSGIKNSNDIAASASQLTEVPDIAILATSDIQQAVIDCEYAGVPVAILPGQTKRIGLQLRSGTMRLLESDQFGYVRPSAYVGVGHVSDLQSGNVAILTQSGLVGLAMVEEIRQCSPACGYSLFACINPYSDVQIHELLTLLQQDDSTEVIGLYLEHLQNNRILLDVIARITPLKPIVILTHTPRLESDRNDKQLLHHFYMQSGALVVNSLTDFSQLVGALAAQLHAGYQRVATFGPDQDHARHWRYSSALRYLSGLHDKCWLAITPEDAQSVETFNEWQQCTSYPTVRLLPSHSAPQPITVTQPSSRTIRVSGAIAPLANAWLYPQPRLQEANVSDIQLKQQLRQQLQSLPAGQPLDLPYIYDLLQHVGLSVMDGCWIDNVLQAERQAGELGWPVYVWKISDDGRVERSRSINSKNTLRQLVRQCLATGAQTWLHSAAARGIDMYIAARRDAQYGPVLHLRVGGVYNSAQVSHLLPLNDTQIAHQLRQLGVPTIVASLDGGQQANLQAIAKAIAAVANASISLPELAYLEIRSLVIDHGLARVADAQLRWE